MHRRTPSSIVGPQVFRPFRHARRAGPWAVPCHPAPAWPAAAAS